MNDPLREAIFEMGRDPTTEPWLNATTEYAPVAQFGHHKYVADIGGLSGTTWNALRNKFRMGSLVFMVDSGYADWWYADLKPWKHYVPVKGDSSDLHQQVIWAESHPADALAIAVAGTAKERESGTEAARPKKKKSKACKPGPSVVEVEGEICRWQPILSRVRGCFETFVGDAPAFVHAGDA